MVRRTPYPWPSSEPSPQLTALFTSAAILASSAAVNSFTPFLVENHRYLVIRIELRASFGPCREMRSRFSAIRIEPLNVARTFKIRFYTRAVHFGIASCKLKAHCFAEIVFNQATGVVMELWGPWTALSRLVSPNQKGVRMLPAMFNRATMRVADTTEVSGRVTADSRSRRHESR